jgi:TRAP transporter 4TM/12TM fusion protein
MVENVGRLKLRKAIFIICLFMGIFQIITSTFRFLSPIPLQNIHIMIAYVIIFLLAMEKNNKTSSSIVYTIFILLTLVATIYIHINYENIVQNVGQFSFADYTIGLLLILITLEATRSSFGIAIPLLTIIFLIYMFVGPYLPGILYHGGFSLKRVISTATISFGGMYGTLLNVSATFLALFMIFGGMLGYTGASEFFMNLALAVGGKMRSGPAMAAVISSGLMGSINGSAVANVATTGVFTIPMMKERGYEPHFAGAVEAAASTGGMILPPVMGVGAFVMAELTGISYAKIAGAALIPALLYYLLIGATIVLHSKKLNLKIEQNSNLPPVWKTLKNGFFHFIPIAAIIYCMVKGYSVTKAGLMGIWTEVIIFVAITILKNPKEAFRKERWLPVLEGVVDGMKGLTGIAATLACVGIMVDCIVSSGLAHRLVGIVLSLGGRSQFLSLFITMIIALIFGMGVPTTASYIILSTMAAPALIQAGLPLLSVHLFVYYFTIIGAITPPVGNACIVASKMASANYNKTCFEAIKLSASAFILPFIFVFRPELLAQGSFLEIVEVAFTATIGLIVLSMTFERIMLVETNIFEQILLIGIGLILIYPAPLWLSIIAIIILAGIYLIQKKRAKFSTTLNNFNP